MPEPISGEKLERFTEAVRIVDDRARYLIDELRTMEPQEVPPDVKQPLAQLVETLKDLGFEIGEMAIETTVDYRPDPKDADHAG